MSVQPVMSEPSKPPPKRRRIACTDDGQTDGYAELQGQFRKHGLLLIALHPDLCSLVAKYLTANQLLRMSYVCHESRSIPKHLFKDKQFIMVMCNQSEHPSRCDERLRYVFEMCAEVHLEVMDKFVQLHSEATDEFRKMYPGTICSVRELRGALMRYVLRKPGVRLSVRCADLEVSGSEVPLNQSQLSMLAAEYVHLGHHLEREAIRTVKSLRNTPNAVSIERPSIEPMYKDLYDVPSLEDHVPVVRLKEKRMIGICSTYAAVMAYIHRDIAVDIHRDNEGQVLYISFGASAPIPDYDPFLAERVSMFLLRELDVFEPPYRLSVVSDHLGKALHEMPSDVWNTKYRGLVELLEKITSVMAPGQPPLPVLEEELRQLFFLGTAPLRPESPERAQKETECEDMLRTIVDRFKQRTDLAASLVQHM